MLHFAPFFYCPPTFPVFEPHIQKWVIFVRRVCDTFRFESLRGKKIECGTDHDK